MLEKISRMKNRISWYLGEIKKAVPSIPYCLFSVLRCSVTLCAALFGLFLVNSLDGERKLGLAGAGILADIDQLDLDLLAYLQVIAHLCHSCRA